MESIVLEPGVKEMLLSDTRDFLRSEKVSFFPWMRELCMPIQLHLVVR